MHTHTLLHIDSSPDLRRSLTRKLTAEFVAAWRSPRFGETVIHRDLARAAVPAPGRDLFEALAPLAPGASRSEDEIHARALSDALVDELFEADALVLGAPVHAHSVPASLKAWLDQVARPDRLRRRERDGSVSGALKGRRVLVVASHEAADLEAARAFHEAYLRHALGAFGIADVTWVPVRRPAAGDAEDEARSLDAARDALRATLVRWSAEEAAALREEPKKAAA